ncbi:hypothetical protein MGN70_010510 [Eutypa lata]|nr:hypothetical protein MGN70_010510 [Eutypa lata]
MPETRDGEHDDTASMLINGSVPESESERLKIFLYQLSNNMHLSDGDIIATVKEVALNSPEWMRILLSSDQPTVSAIKENVFGAAMRSLDVDLVNQLLDTGMNPNIPIVMVLPDVKISVPRGRQVLHISWSHFGYSCTPLQWAVSARKVELVNALICAGANVGLCLQVQDLSPLELACGIATPGCDSVALKIAKRLVSKGALVNRAVYNQRPTALFMAVASGNVNLTEFIVQSGAEDFEQRLPSLPERYAFQIALLKGDLTILRILGRLPSYEQRVLRHVDLPITAVCSQDPMNMLLYLCRLGIDIRKSSNWACSPLTIAIFLEDSALSHILLDYYGSVSPGQSHTTKPPPIHAAACTGDISLMERLLRQGASVNETIGYLNRLDVEKLHEIYKTFSINHSYDSWKDVESPLKIAIGAGHVEAAMFLLAKGSILLGGELVMAARLGNNDLVQKLLAIQDIRGSLPTLDGGFLKTAIEHGNRDIALALIKPGSRLVDGEYVLALMNEDNELADMIAAHTPRSALLKPGPLGQSPLEVACATGNIEVAENLLSRNEARYESSSLCAASWNAVSKQQYGLVETLI